MSKTITHDQKLILVYILNDLLALPTVLDGTINKIIKIILSESMFLERYDLVKRLFDNGLIQLTTEG